MFGDQLNLSHDAVKALIGYVVPAILAALLSVVGPLADFAWSEVIRTWRGLIVLASLLAALLINPKYSVWVALLVFVLFVVKRIMAYRVGPKLKKTGVVPILFSGFYQTNSSGKFKRSGNSSITEVKFLKILNQVLADHRIQEAIPMKIVLFRPPRIIHSRYNYESFERLMRRYASTTLAVMWGVIDEQGRIRNFEVTSFEEHYFGREKALKVNEDIARVCQLDAAHTDAVVDFLASSYAAIWGHSFCEVLNLEGKWQASYLVAGNSRRLFEKALNQLQESTGEAGRTMVDFERKQVLPIFVTQEAIGLLKGDQWTDAVKKLVEALKLNPLWPCYNAEEFADFYSHRYAWEIATRHEEEIATDETRELLTETAKKSSKRAWLDIPPNLQYLKQWLNYPPNNIDNLDARIEKWFNELLTTHPSNCFILLYWADAIKIPSYVKNRKNEESGMLPLQVLDKAIEKCEEAYKLCPTLPVIAARLSGLYVSSLSSFKESDPEYKRRLDKFTHYLWSGKMFYTETLPPDSVKGIGNASARGT